MPEAVAPAIFDGLLSWYVPPPGALAAREAWDWDGDEPGHEQRYVALGPVLQRPAAGQETPRIRWAAQ